MNKFIGYWVKVKAGLQYSQYVQNNNINSLKLVYK